MTGMSAEAELLGVAVGVAALGGAGVLALGRGPAVPTSTRGLEFGAELTAGEVCGVLDVAAGLGRGSELRCLVYATADEIRHAVVGRPGVIETIERSSAALAPSVRLTATAANTESMWPPLAEARGAVLCWTGNHSLLKTDDAELGNGAILGALSGLRSDEGVWLQLVLAPAGRVGRPAIENRRGQRPVGVLQRVVTGVDVPVGKDNARAALTKFAEPLLRVRVVVGVQAADPGRAHHLVGRVAGAVRTRSGARGRLRVRSLGPSRLQRAWRASAARGDLLAPAEVAGLLAWPVGAPSLPELRYGLAPRRLADRAIPSSGRGRLFGVSTWPGAEGRRVIQPWQGAICHGLLLGPSGSGKSWLLAGLLLGQIEAGDGVVLLDMKGDTAGDVLERIAAKRRDSVLVIEPSNGLAVPGLRSFVGPPELAADLLLTVFRGLFPSTFGIRSERYLRMVFQSLPHDPEATLADAPRIFSDPSYRRRVVGRLSDPLLLAQWAEFEALSEPQKSEHLASPLSKLAEVLSRSVVRSMLAQVMPKLTIAEAIRRGMVVVASFPPGVLGAPAARLLGALVVYEVYQAVMARQALDPRQRRRFGFYLDEPAVLGSLPVPLDSLFETARGMGCGVTMAAQSLVQLPADVQRAAATNAATIAAFRPAADDAARAARELPGITSQELQLLEPFTLALKLGLAPGRVAPVCTVRSQPLIEPTVDADVIRQASAKRFGRRPADIDAELRRRHGLAAPSAGPDAPSARPLGERRRAS